MSRTLGLLDAVYAAVVELSPIATATVERSTLGDRLLLLEIADGDGNEAAGVAHRPPGDLPVDPEGVRALEVASWVRDSAEAGDPLRTAVGVASMNALSAPLIEWSAGDPFEALSADVSTIATVGLFGPAFRKFGAVDVRVIERRDVEVPETSEGVTVDLFGPEEAEAAMNGADVVFVTGSTLLYGGTAAYLEAATEAGVPDVVLVGATASFVPEPAFDAGATMLAGARVTDTEAVRRGALAGECATDLHDEGLEKVYVTSDGSTGYALELE